MGLIRGMAKTGAVAGTAAAVAKRVAQRQQSRHPGAPATPATPATPAAPVAPAGDDVTTKLNRLSALRQSGQLTEQEYAAAKAQVLGL